MRICTYITKRSIHTYHIFSIILILLYSIVLANVYELHFVSTYTLCNIYIWWFIQTNHQKQLQTLIPDGGTEAAGKLTGLHALRPISLTLATLEPVVSGMLAHINSYHIRFYFKHDLMRSCEQHTQTKLPNTGIIIRSRLHPNEIVPHRFWRCGDRLLQFGTLRQILASQQLL